LPAYQEQIFIHSTFGTAKSTSKPFVSVEGTITARINISCAVSLTSLPRPLHCVKNQIISFAILFPIHSFALHKFGQRGCTFKNVFSYKHISKGTSKKGHFVMSPLSESLKRLISPYNRSQRPRRRVDYSCTLSLTSAVDGVGGQRHASAALPPAKTRYPLYRRLGGTQYRSGRVRKISASTGIRSPDRRCRSE